jgi:hypothetical protein
MRTRVIKIFGLGLLILHCLSQVSLSEELIQAPAAIHISSTISDGKYSIPEIIKIAKQNNIKIVVITDRDSMRWEYGLWPLRNIIKKTVEMGCIFKYGIKCYLKEIESIQKANPDLILIPGMESAPFYYWQGSPLDNSLKLKNWHKHILVIGLEKAQDYQNLPVVGNKPGLALPFRFQNIFYLLWPILILVAGFLFFRKRQFSYKDWHGRQLGPYSRNWRVLGIFLIIVSLLFLWNNYPFCDFKFDQYRVNAGVAPYQNFINYVHQHGGLTFWAHPEAEYIQARGRVKIETQEHTVDLLEAYDYTGFAVFYEGYKKVGFPGGIWDEILKQYCQGQRKAPIWAIAGLSFDTTGDLKEYIRDLRTVCLIPKLDKAEVLKALGDGKVYVIRGSLSSQFVLDKFIIKDTLSGIEKGMGEEIALKQKPQLEIGGHFLKAGQQPCKIKLIKNGIIVKTFDTASAFNVTYEDQNIEKDKKIYYRIEIESKGMLLVSNPIFVKFI